MTNITSPHLTKMVEAPLMLHVVVGFQQLGAPPIFHDFAIAYTDEEAHKKVADHARNQGLTGGMMMTITKFYVEDIEKELGEMKPKVPEAFQKDYSTPEEQPTPARRPFRELTMLIRDRHAKTALERKVLNGIIRRIDKS